MSHIGTQRLETDRLILRRFSLDDAGAVFNNYASDTDVTRYTSLPTHQSTADSLEWCELNVSSYPNLEYYSWAIVLKSSDDLIGGISAVAVDNSIRKATVGYSIGKPWWNHGYASEALIAIVRFLFEEVGLNRIEAFFDPRNPYSGKVMEKAGMRYEGTHRQAGLNNQGIYDSVVHAILAEDYQLNKEKGGIDA